jgi:hypothetical protein
MLLLSLQKNESVKTKRGVRIDVSAPDRMILIARQAEPDNLSFGNRTLPGYSNRCGRLRLYFKDPIAVAQ